MKDRRNGRIEAKALPPPAALVNTPPPHDPARERALIAGVLDGSNRASDVGFFRAQHMYLGSHQIIWSALCLLEATGAPVDKHSLIAALAADRPEPGGPSRLDQVGGPSYVVEIWESTPATLPKHFEAHARDLVTLAKLRELAAVGQRMAARCFVDRADPSDVFAEAERLVAEVVDTAPGRALRRIGIDEMLAPRPPEPNYLCKGLRFAPGRVVLVAGAPDSGKTLAIQSLAASFASGRDAWGVFNVRRGRVVHFNWDQPRDDTERRYDKLLRGLHLGADDVRGYLELIDDPPISFDDDAAFGELRAIARDAACIIIDALTGSLGEVDENSPAVGRVLRRIGKISEQTGCVIIVIHHAIKPPATFKGKKLERDAMFDVRGSGSIAGASGAMFVQSAIRKGELYSVKMVRTPTFAKRALDAFALKFEDLVDEDLVDGRRREAAVTVTYVSPEELEALETPKKKPEVDASGAFEQLVYRAVELMKAHPGSSGSALHARAGKVTERRFFAALHDARRRGLAAAEKGPNRSELWRAT